MCSVFRSRGGWRFVRLLGWGFRVLWIPEFVVFMGWRCCECFCRSYSQFPARCARPEFYSGPPIVCEWNSAGYRFIFLVSTDYRRLVPCRSVLLRTVMFGLYFEKGRRWVKRRLCCEGTVKSCELLANVLRNALMLLRNDLKFNETWRTGDFNSSADEVKIDGDSGAVVLSMRCVPVHASSASRAKHNCTRIRFGERRSSPVRSVACR